ncbi:MAG: TssN family type VI secretion system protein [bacterium]
MKALGLGVVVIFLLIAVALLSITLSKAKEAKKYTKASIIYMVVCAFCFGVVALTGLFGMQDNLYAFFMVTQVLILIIGILHSILFYNLVLWSSRTKFVWEFLFSLATALLGAALFLLVYNFILKVHVLQFIMLTGIIWFFVPFFFVQAFTRYLMIPARIFKKWHYPVGKEINDPLDSELVSLLVVSFVFHKKMNDPEITTFRAKAPAHMMFGRLFYYFLNDYNERHREGPIEFLDSRELPHGWVFHHKPNWLGRKRYIDPEQIITDNHIRENSVIICQRIKES